jgi:hypothetical protein
MGTRWALLFKPYGPLVVNLGTLLNTGLGFKGNAQGVRSPTLVNEKIDIGQGYLLSLSRLASALSNS